jgi:transcriptional regulator with XRE-family HTH domain
MHGIAGLHNDLKPGRPRSTSEDEIAALINTALTRKPAGRTHWSQRALADETGLSKSTVHRYLTLFGLQPHRSKSFKLSNDPFFIEKVRDIVGLYLNPPDHALVLCVDEKSQRQELERTQPVLPMGLRYVEGITHDGGQCAPAERAPLPRRVHRSRPAAGDQRGQAQATGVPVARQQCRKARGRYLGGVAASQPPVDDHAPRGRLKP